MTDPRPSEVQALAALLHQRTWLTHDVPQESPCGYCERVALWLDGQGVGVRVATSPTGCVFCNTPEEEGPCFGGDRCMARVAPSPDAPGLREAIEEIRWTGTDCPAAMQPKSFYRQQLHRVIGIAARAALASESHPTKEPTDGDL